MTAWMSEGSRIVCRWMEVGEGTVCASRCLKEAMNGSFLPPPPDFASHSPFGGAMWITPHLVFGRNRSQ